MHKRTDSTVQSRVVWGGARPRTVARMPARPLSWQLSRGPADVATAGVVPDVSTPAVAFVRWGEGLVIASRDALTSVTSSRTAARAPAPMVPDCGHAHTSAADAVVIGGNANTHARSSRAIIRTDRL